MERREGAERDEEGPTEETKRERGRLTDRQIESACEGGRRGEKERDESSSMRRFESFVRAHRIECKHRDVATSWR